MEERAGGIGSGTGNGYVSFGLTDISRQDIVTEDILNEYKAVAAVSGHIPDVVSGNGQ